MPRRAGAPYLNSVSRYHPWRQSVTKIVGSLKGYQYLSKLLRAHLLGARFPVVRALAQVELGHADRERHRAGDVQFDEHGRHVGEVLRETNRGLGQRDVDESTHA